LIQFLNFIVYKLRAHYRPCLQVPYKFVIISKLKNSRNVEKRTPSEHVFRSEPDAMSFKKFSWYVHSMKTSDRALLQLLQYIQDFLETKMSFGSQNVT
jgi:hypothetical protein